MRAMLDQLMGTDRTGGKCLMIVANCFGSLKCSSFVIDEGKKSQFYFTDGRICKSFLLECCPNEVLAATVSLTMFAVVGLANECFF